jgi:steroid 5-alpha reductase family enzyme
MNALVTQTLLLTAIVTLAAFFLCWIVSVRLRDCTVIDAWWGAGFGAIALIGIGRMEAAPASALWIAGAVTLWGARLTWHLWTRHTLGQEDARYAAMRARGGPVFWLRSLIIIFGLQALVQWLLALPILLSILNARADALPVLMAAGMVVFCIGFVIETIADAQLKAFKADPSNKGKLLQTGLFAHVRHPNYAGEIVLWTGIALMACAASGQFWPLLTPLVIWLLLTRVSGVPLLDIHLGQGRAGHAQYRASVPALWPWMGTESKQKK